MDDKGQAGRHRHGPVQEGRPVRIRGPAPEREAGAEQGHQQQARGEPDEVFPVGIRTAPGRERVVEPSKQDVARADMQEIERRRPVVGDVLEAVHAALERRRQVDAQERKQAPEPGERVDGLDPPPTQQPGASRTRCIPPVPADRHEKGRHPGGKAEQAEAPDDVEAGQQADPEQQGRSHRPERCPYQPARHRLPDGLGSQDAQDRHERHAEQLRVADLQEAVVGQGEEGGADDAGCHRQAAETPGEQDEAAVPHHLEDDVDQLPAQERIDPCRAEDQIDHAVNQEPVVVAERVRMRKEVRDPVPGGDAGEGGMPMLQYAELDQRVAVIARQHPKR